MVQIKPTIIFDLDGTLIDISDRYFELYKKIVNELKGKPLSKSAYWKLKRGKSDTVNILMRSSLTGKFEDIYDKKFLEEIENLEFLKLDKLIPDTKKILNSLNKYDLYLYTLRKSEGKTRAQLSRLGIRDYFKKTLFKKTAGTKSSMVPKKLSSNICFIVGDTEADILTAKTLGFVSIATLSGLRDKTFMQTLEPSYIISDIHALPHTLKQHFNKQTRRSSKV